MSLAQMSYREGLLRKAERLATILEKAYEGETRDDLTDIITRLRSQYVSEMNIEQAERMLKHHTPNVSNVIRLLTEMRDNDPRACLRLPAHDGWPETRWRMQGGSIAVSLRAWDWRGDTGRPPETLFVVRPSGLIETSHNQLRDVAYKFVAQLGAEPEKFLRTIGKQRRTCPVCRRHLSDFYAPRGLHPSCEKIAGFEAGPVEDHRKPVSKDVNKHRKAAEKLFKKA